jgi:hypothetical protein
MGSWHDLDIKENQEMKHLVAAAATTRRPSCFRPAKIALALLLAACCLQLSVPQAEARRGRGSSRAMQQAMKKQQQMFAKWMAEYQKAQKEQYDAFMKRFDSNGNGKIDGKEKGPAQKYLRELQMGKNPDKLKFTTKSKPESKSKSKSKSSFSE